MTSTLETLLRAWGRAYGERSDYGNDDRTGPAVHPIAVAMQFAPGRKVRRLDIALRRSIRKGERAWSRDPITCTETRPSGGGGRGSDSAVERVQTLVLQLRRSDEARGLAITAEYCKLGTQREKAEWVSAQGHRMAVRAYREKLASARGWIEAKIAA